MKYSIGFKENLVKKITTDGQKKTAVSAEYGVTPETLHDRIRLAKDSMLK